MKKFVCDFVYAYLQILWIQRATIKTEHANTKTTNINYGNMQKLKKY